MKSRNKKSRLWVGQPVSDSLNSAARFLYIVMALEIASSFHLEQKPNIKYTIDKDLSLPHNGFRHAIEH